MSEAHAYLHGQGLHLLPLGTNKRPAIQWRYGPMGDLVFTQAPLDRVQRWADKYPGLAIVCGGPSRVICLDVEAAGMAYPDITTALLRFPETCLRRTPSGGMHAWVRITSGELPMTQKLAMRRDVLLAEIRGEGAYAAILGPRRDPLSKRFAPVPMSAEAFRDMVNPILRLDQRPVRAPKIRKEWDGETKGDIAEELFEMVREEPELILDVLDKGWTIRDYDWGGRLILIRPPYGGVEATSGSSANVLDGIFVAYSTAIPWADPGVGYTPAQVLAEANYGGDFRKAMVALERRAMKVDPWGSLRGAM